MKYFIAAAAVLLIACSGNRRITQPVAKKTLNDSTARIYSLDQQSDKDVVYYITPSGKKIFLRKINPETPPPVTITERVADSVQVIMRADVVPGSLASGAEPDDPFTGSIRAIPKTTYSTKNTESFRTIPALYRKLESKEFLNGQGIGNRNERTAWEDRNVKIGKAYLYTITIEDDNDLHLLIGNTPSYVEGVTRVFNAEISAVPVNGTTEVKNHIRDLRRKVLAELGDIPLCDRVGYLQSNHKISIRGSLFYDTHHKTKFTKCNEVEGESAWEMHPVWDISF
jgi:hypothetical protein